jgi:hypothetical protein
LSLSDLTLPSINGSKRGFFVTPNFKFSISDLLDSVQIDVSVIR